MPHIVVGKNDQLLTGGIDSGQGAHDLSVQLAAACRLSWMRPASELLIDEAAVRRNDARHRSPCPSVLLAGESAAAVHHSDARDRPADLVEIDSHLRHVVCETIGPFEGDDHLNWAAAVRRPGQAHGRNSGVQDKGRWRPEYCNASDASPWSDAMGLGQ